MRISLLFSRISLVLLALLATIVFLPQVASADSPAASVTISRSPAPPSAVVNDGSHSLNYDFTVLFNSSSTPVEVRTQILDSNQTPVTGTTQYTSISTASSPYNSSPLSYTVPAGLAPGVYYVQVAYYSQQFCNNNTCTGPGDANNYEAEAQADFHVTAATGTLIIQKFNDLNGNGLREGNEPGVPNWPFQVTAPNPNGVGTTTYDETTSADGSITLTDVPVGSYSVSEILPDPNPLAWSPTTANPQSAVLVTGQTATLQFGNVELTSLCGTVYADQNRVGTFQAGQPGVAGVQVTLGGMTGLGNAVTGTQTTDSSGNYCFTGLYPGTYNVKETGIPAPYTAETDIDGNANGPNYINPIAVTSGQPSGGNNFLIVAPLPIQPPPPPTPQTKLCLVKSVNHKHVHQGGTVSWTLKVTDCGTNTAVSVSITDPLMSDIILVSEGHGALVRGQLIWAVGNLKPGQSKVYHFTTQFDTNAALGKHVNHASADASNAPRVATQATTTVVATYRPPVVVRVTG